MTEDVDMGVLDRRDQTSGHFRPLHAQERVATRHHHIDPAEQRLVLVEGAVVEDVDFDAGQHKRWPERRDPPEDLLRAAASAGCRFTIDSDAHAPGQLSWLPLGCEQAVAAGIPAHSIVNTLPLDDFLAWARSHG